MTPFRQKPKQRLRTPRVLIATSMGGYQHGALVESVVARSLRQRGCDVRILLCNSFLPACQLSEIGQTSAAQLQSPQPRCTVCMQRGEQLFGSLDFPIHWYGYLVSKEQRLLAAEKAESVSLDDMFQFKWKEYAVGEHALAGAIRYFARTDIENEPNAEQVAQKYLEAAFLTVFAVEELLRREYYDVVCFNHGIYVPMGLIGEVCRKNGVRVVNWNPAYRKQRFIFSEGDSYHHTMISEPTELWKTIPWSETLETETMNYLRSRVSGTNDWIWFHDQPENDINAIANELGLSLERPWVTLLTSVAWDAQLHYSANAFDNMFTWIRQSVEYFKNRLDLQLVIRVHPAELRGAIPSRERVVESLKQWCPELPKNIIVIPPEHPASTYALCAQSNAVLIYNTKTGIEIASLGIPVIVAGEAWIRNKGFSIDLSSPEEYRKVLEQLPYANRMSDEQTRLAKKYAFHFFFRRMIPLPFITALGNGKFELTISNDRELAVGRYLGLDVICHGIMHGTPFIYPEEHLQYQLAIDQPNEQCEVGL